MEISVREAISRLVDMFGKFHQENSDLKLRAFQGSFESSDFPSSWLPEGPVLSRLLSLSCDDMQKGVYWTSLHSSSFCGI